MTHTHKKMKRSRVSFIFFYDDVTYHIQKKHEKKKKDVLQSRSQGQYLLSPFKILKIVTRGSLSREEVCVFVVSMELQGIV